jgi:hypothetical protein
MARHFELEITETRFAFTRKQEQIDAEAALDGLYVVPTNGPGERISDAQTVLAYKSLPQVERTFRSMKTVDLHVRPIYHFSESRVRARVSKHAGLLCRLPSAPLRRSVTLRSDRQRGAPVRRLNRARTTST